MNDISYRFTLDINDAASQMTLAVKRTERGRILRIAFCASGEPVELPDGCYAVFNARRAADGAVFCGDTVVYRDAVQVSLDAVIGTVCGRIDCDISVYTADGATVLSPSFRIVVYSSALGNDEVEDTDEFRTLSELVMDAEELQSKSEGLNAETEALQREAEELCSDAASLQSKSEELNAETEALQREASEVASEVRAALSSGVTSFNGRVGTVVPQVGDYTADMVGADASGAASAAVLAHNGADDAHPGKFANAGHTHQASEISGLATWLDDNGYAGDGGASGTYYATPGPWLYINVIENATAGGVKYNFEVSHDDRNTFYIGGTFGTLEIACNGLVYRLSAGQKITGYAYLTKCNAWTGPWPVIEFTGSEIIVTRGWHFDFSDGTFETYDSYNLPYFENSTSSGRVHPFALVGRMHAWRAY